jgi:hypothetical protein
VDACGLDSSGSTGRLLYTLRASLERFEARGEAV